VHHATRRRIARAAREAASTSRQAIHVKGGSDAGQPRD
jgi:hypothetical protein